MTVALKVQWKAQGRQQQLFHHPWFLDGDPSHARMVGHPPVENPFSWVGEGATSPAAHPAQLDAERVRQQASQGQPDGGAFRVARDVVTKPAPERPLARLRRASLGPLRSDADLEQDVAGHLMTALDRHPGRHPIEVPSVDPGELRGSGPGFFQAVQVVRSQ